MPTILQQTYVYAAAIRKEKKVVAVEGAEKNRNTGLNQISPDGSRMYLGVSKDGKL